MRVNGGYLQLFSMSVELILGVAMGFIPYVDNFGMFY